MIKSIVKSGLITGAAITLYMVFLYTAGLDIYANWLYSIVMFPIAISLACYYSIQIKNQFDSAPFDYKHSFVVLFSILMLATLVNTVWHIILFNTIDTTLAKELSVHLIEQTKESMINWGVPETAIKEALKEMKDLPLQFKPIGQIITWLKTGILLVFLSLVFAAFVKRKATGNPFKA